MRRQAAAGCCAAAALALGACESTQDKSARLERTGKGQALLTKVDAGATNTAVKVGATKLLSANGLHAAVVELDNRGASAQAQLPVLIDVKDAKGTSLYRNDIQGLQPSLQQMAYLAKGQRAYWVNDQVLATTTPKSLTVQVGMPKEQVPPSVPRIVLEKTRLDSDSSGAYATGVIRNLSKIVQRNVPVFAVALKGAKVVAAGRGLVPRLDPDPTSKPVTFRIFFVGSPAGAQIRYATAPTALKEP